MMNDEEAQLGDEASDMVSGFQGVVTAKTEFLNGCVRCAIDPPVDKDGKPVDTRWFDIEQLEVVQRGKVVPKATWRTTNVTGGERPDCPPR